MVLASVGLLCYAQLLKKPDVLQPRWAQAAGGLKDADVHTQKQVYTRKQELTTTF